jgi:tRNA A-37 threonylcarbamoyl transferase component Bud32
MTMTECPSSGVLTELAIEGGDPDQVLAHLEACSDCRGRYEEIKAILAGVNLLISSTAATPSPPPTRRTPEVIGRYFVVGKTAESPGATIYRAVQAAMQDNEFAIILADEPWENPEALQPAFESASAPLEKLDHPLIAPAEDVGSFDDRPFIAFKYVDGEPLGRSLAKRSITAVEAARIGSELARALASAHRAGLVHGSFAVESIRIDRRGRPVIADFAASRLLRDPANSPDSAVDRAAFGALLRQLGEETGSKPLEALGARAGSTDLEEMARNLDRLASPARRVLWIAAGLLVMAGLAAGIWWLIGGSSSP